MTTKRFTILEDTNGGLDNVLETMVKDNGKFLTHKECCDLLNNLHEENNQLKERNEFLKKQLDRVCIDNEEMGDKLKKIGKIL